MRELSPLKVWKVPTKMVLKIIIFVWILLLRDVRTFRLVKKNFWFSQFHTYFCFDLSIKHEIVNESFCVEENKIIK